MKYLCIIQALFLTALVVHNIHLEGELRNSVPLAFYDSNSPEIGTVSNIQPLNNEQVPDNLPITLLPEDESRNADIQELSDILGSQGQDQADTDTDTVNHTNALFGGMKDGKGHNKGKKG